MSIEHDQKIEESLASSVKLVLFVTLSNIGDVVMTTPVMEALHQRYPDAVFDIVCDRRSSMLLENCPYLRRLIFKEKRSGLAGFFRLWRAIRQEHYDLAVDLRTDGLLYAVKANQKFWKFSAHNVNALHSVEKHFEAIKGLVPWHIPQPRLWVTSEHQIKASKLLEPYLDQRFIAIGLGANSTGKIWPANCYAQMVNRLSSCFDRVILIGNAEEARLSQAFTQECQLPVMDFSGRCDLLTSAAILAHAKIFVGNDSGLGHMAAALCIPSFTVFGQGEPHRYAPWHRYAYWYQSPERDIHRIQPEYVAETILLKLGQQLDCHHFEYAQ